MISAKEFQEALHLECLVEPSCEQWDIRSPELNRPGMQFCGFYEYFAFERPQVIGKVEMTYLERRSAEERKAILEKFFSFRIPCLIICRNMEPPPELESIARAHHVCEFRSASVTAKFTANAIMYLNR